MVLTCFALLFSTLSHFGRTIFANKINCMVDVINDLFAFRIERRARCARETQINSSQFRVFHLFASRPECQRKRNSQQNTQFHRGGVILHQFMKKCAVNESNSFRCRGNFSESRFGRAQRGRREKEDAKRSRGGKRLFPGCSNLRNLSRRRPSLPAAAQSTRSRTPGGEKRDENLSEI